MVKVGGFTLEIVNAETHEPFKEHTSADGKTFIEAEPDLEYFIRLRSDRGVETPGVLTYATIQVDGTKLDYNHRFSTKSENLGLWNVQNGVNSYTALRFVLQRTRAVEGPPAAGTGPTPSEPPVGKVTANFYECTKAEGTYVQTDRDSASSFRPNQPATFNASADPKNKKGFKSEAGSITSTSASSIAARPNSKDLVKQRYKRGRKLGSVTLYYCSALGLIHANILPRYQEEENDDAPGNRRGRDVENAPLAAATAPAAAAAAGVSAPAAAHNAVPDRKRVKTDPAMQRGGGGVVDLTSFDSDSD